MLRHLAEQSGTLRLDDREVPLLTLGAKVELACAIGSWREHGPVPASDAESLIRADPQLAAIISSLWNQTVHPVDMYSAPTFEVQPTPAGGTDTDCSFFCQRFKKSLVDNGRFDPSVARKLAGALAEMIDNVIQHSGASKEEPARGVMAYSVASHAMVYAVGDIGRGILASLQTNILWASLTTASTALRAAVQEGASRRQGTQGTGFKTAIKALADLNGMLRFRTHDAALSIDGQSPTGRLGALSASPSLPGLQLSIASDGAGRCKNLT